MAEYFVKTVAIIATPSDANDGRDPIGFNLSGATYDDTGNGEGDYHISSAGAFSSYTWNSGDQIYLDGGAGITAGLYTIASKVDADAILLTESAGSDSTADVSSSDGPWAGLQHAADTAAGGDIVDVCADGTHAPTATVDFDTNAGTATSRIKFRGASARGVPGTQPTISGTSLGVGTSLFNINLSAINLNLENLRLTAGKDHNVLITSSCGACKIVIESCRTDNATDHGIRIENSNSFANYQLTDNEIDGNSVGLGVNTGSRGGCQTIKCSVHDNTNNGITDSGNNYARVEILDCKIYDNGGKGIRIQANNSGAVIKGNTIFANGSDGIALDSAVTLAWVANNILRSNGGYNINTNSGSVAMFAYCDYNCSHNGTSGHIDINSGVLPGDNNVTSDPLFTSETDGSEDFSLQSSSPCLDVGLGFTS